MVKLQIILAFSLLASFVYLMVTYLSNSMVQVRGKYVFLGWSISDVCKWVKDNFDDEVANKFKVEEITGEMLVNSTRLTQENSMGRLGLTTLGKQEKFSKLISKLRGKIFMLIKKIKVQ